MIKTLEFRRPFILTLSKLIEVRGHFSASTTSTCNFDLRLTHRRTGWMVTSTTKPNHFKADDKRNTAACCPVFAFYNTNLAFGALFDCGVVQLPYTDTRKCKQNLKVQHSMQIRIPDPDHDLICQSQTGRKAIAEAKFVRQTYKF